MTRTMLASEIDLDFGAALDAVVKTGEAIRIERHGEIVAELRPVEAMKRPSSTVLAELMRDLPPDPEFADDLEQIHAEGNRELPRNPWDD